ncbi:hypothetical protein LOK46_02185 [Methylobacterium sp. NMS14P]|uniref:hypothetical protein n=1 Tax=Methylobacterium sp. NMS14P TaxID=2894310 RepID=UPI002359A8B4|nr:hypothetical protein [Methylobacterium sp. NMS14P]WCS25675.1 hypothetical protein LOK46_02185 [Methylobacterium sp. NMS14P]
MRLAILAFALSAASLAAHAEAPGEVVAIGPWKVEAVSKGQKFDRCTMTRTTDDGVDVRFSRDADGLDLTMSSPKWKLGRGKSYPVELAAGSSTLQADVAASGNTVSLPVKDEKFLRSLKLADGLEVKGEGATIKVALDKSAAALDRLEACYAKNGSATERNPFVAPSGKP